MLTSVTDRRLGYPKILPNTGFSAPIVNGIVESGHGGALLGRQVTTNTRPAVSDLFVKVDPKPVAFPMNPDHLKVLVIDDEATILTVTCLMLKKLGICPRGVTSGQEAVEVIRKEADEIELLFLDILLADTTGFRVYREVRKFRETLPIIFFSGFSVQSELGETLRLDPLTRFMPKPFGMAELESVLLAP